MHSLNGRPFSQRVSIVRQAYGGSRAQQRVRPLGVDSRTCLFLASPCSAVSVNLDSRFHKLILSASSSWHPGRVSSRILQGLPGENRVPSTALLASIGKSLEGILCTATCVGVWAWDLVPPLPRHRLTLQQQKTSIGHFTLTQTCSDTDNSIRPYEGCLLTCCSFLEKKCQRE